MLTPTQYQTLKTFIETTAPYSSINNDEDGDFAIRDLLNAIASPAFKVWNPETPVTFILMPLISANTRLTMQCQQIRN